MALICLGYDVSFDMADGGKLNAPSRAALLFDPSGQLWPRCGVLIKSFRRGGGAIDKDDRFARQWFGKGYRLFEGGVNVPERDLSAWKTVGPAARIFYTRGSGDRSRSAKYAGDYEHPFGARSIFNFFSRKLPVLYERGGDLRLEMGGGCRVTERGFESP